MHLGFTGTRQGMTISQLKAVKKYLDKATAVLTVHHGVCIGADEQFHILCHEKGLLIEGHYPRDWRYKANIPEEQFSVIWTGRPYLLRNKDIVDKSDMLLATPKGFYEELRSGTWSTVRYARRHDKPVLIIYPDGGESVEKVTR